MKTYQKSYSLMKKPLVKKEEYFLETFRRSNQDTCLTHKPAVMEGAWVQSGDLLTDCASSVGGELSLGQNLLIAYMPWEGYNFEDAILISERLVMDDLYTSVHIERYELEMQKTKLGAEEITRDIPDVSEKELGNLDSFGVVKLGSWVEEGDILVGKITPINKKKISPYQKLLYTILEKQVRPIKDSSLRAPKGIKAKVIDIKYFLKSSNFINPSGSSAATGLVSHAGSGSWRSAGSSPLRSLTGQKQKTDKNSNKLSKSKAKKNQQLSTNTANKFGLTVVHNSFQQRSDLSMPSSSGPNLGASSPVPAGALPEGFPALPGVRKNYGQSSEQRSVIQPNVLSKAGDPPTSPYFSNLLGETSPTFATSLLTIRQSANLQGACSVYGSQGQLESAEMEKQPPSWTLFLGNRKAGLMKPLSLKRTKGKKGFFLPKMNWSFSKIKKNSFYLYFRYLRSILLKTTQPKQKASSLNFNMQNPFGLRFNPSNFSDSSYTFGAFGAFVENKKGKRVLPHMKKRTKTRNNSLQQKAMMLQNVETIHIYLAEKRKIQVGDKMAGRHGNKGIVSQILPIQDMPYLPDGTPIDMVLNPLGVPSRMNVGQIYECLLGLAGRFLGENYKVYSFDEIYGPEASRAFVFHKLYEARSKTGFKWLFDPNSPGKIRLFDGRNGQCFDQKVTVGQAYILRLVHMVDDKIHARSTGPYSLVTQQPLRGRSKQGGQRLGEMEVWALEGYGAAFTLLEMLTIKSDDMTGRMTLWSNLILNKDISIGTPESFKVLVCELQALCLDIGLFRNIESHNENPNLREIENLMNLP